MSDIPQGSSELLDSALGTQSGVKVNSDNWQAIDEQSRLDDGYTYEDDRTTIFTPSYTVATFLEDNLRTTLIPGYDCTTAVTTLGLHTETTTDLRGFGHWVYDVGAMDNHKDTLSIHRGFAAHTPNTSLGSRGMLRRDVEDALRGVDKAFSC